MSHGLFVLLLLMSSSVPILAAALHVFLSAKCTLAVVEKLFFAEGLFGIGGRVCAAVLGCMVLCIISFSVFQLALLMWCASLALYSLLQLEGKICVSYLLLDTNLLLNRLLVC